MNRSNEVDRIPNRALADVHMSRFSDAGLTIQSDVLAVEEPLEIRLGCDVDGRRVHRAVSITMRTPGHDPELAVGFLFTEGIIAAKEQVTAVRACGVGNVVRVDLLPGQQHTFQIAVGRSKDADEAMRRLALLGPSEAGPVITRSTTRERERQCAN